MFLKSSSFYDVYIKSDPHDALDSAVYIKDGFSFWAAILTFFWFFYHKMWVHGAVFFILLSVLAGLSYYGHVNQLILITVRLGVFVLVGFNANDWLGNVLHRRGYNMTSVIGTDVLDVKKRFGDTYFQQYQEIPDLPNAQGANS